MKAPGHVFIAYLRRMNIFKSALITVVVILTALSACNNGAQQKESSTGEANKMDEKKGASIQKIDNATSTVVWHGSDPAQNHMGTIGISDGEMKFDENGNITGGNITIDMNSIIITDDMKEEKKPKLLSHLKSDDFFATDSFPTAKFEISKIDHNEGNNHVIKGNLTIRGKVLGIEVPAVIITKEGTTNVKANFSIDRTKWGVKYHSKAIDSKMKDKFIYDMIELNIDLNSKK